MINYYEQEQSHRNFCSHRVGTLCWKLISRVTAKSSEGTSAEIEEALSFIVPGHYVSGCLKYKKFGLIYVLAWVAHLFH